MPEKRKHLTRHEVGQILHAADRGIHYERDYCLIQMCFLHGLRVSELCRLQLSDLDLGGRSVYVRRLKNSLSTQHPLFDEEIPALKRWLNVRRRWRDADSGWLFLSQKGGPLSRHQVRVLLKRYGEKAGVSIPAHPHMLRHGCGYALADLGKDTRLIQDYLGHRNIQHTVIYTATNTLRFVNMWGNVRENHTFRTRM
ncbi:TPA: tyrosine-type recombinase/integrase [Klebsiella quasipneumoniae subsp. quasipneumoniae]|nr:tyrosine-type recombinase/integrase [Klebsiella quasipneumoniae subsp. similipneumoniae]HBR1458097.1 tyrosine-type recombinase/integrase [Klebsiella quasipneumoniae subsp. quasipneumoniae]HBR1982848.1 tyrosine-type recombinase/integrase [Klebsiella quasipneumoniae subsp. quasipneumoniae]HBR2036007.1 tyrosine-type recombinase/integrase [Klebsiella quasipneumoniae subsp. quasipneumoniae]HCI6432701.1 tyrosine-type recombinase/integrase [Klebsiella quasipneumoniae subsp. similipneumoniae]